MAHWNDIKPELNVVGAHVRPTSGVQILDPQVQMPMPSNVPDWYTLLRAVNAVRQKISCHRWFLIAKLEEHMRALRSRDLRATACSAKGIWDRVAYTPRGPAVPCGQSTLRFHDCSAQQCMNDP